MADRTWFVVVLGVVVSAQWLTGCVGEVGTPETSWAASTDTDGGASMDEQPYDDEPDARAGDAGAKDSTRPGARSDGGAVGSLDEPGDSTDPEPSDAAIDPDTDTDTDKTAGMLMPGTLRWVGRTDHQNPSAARFSWQGAGVVATVTGSSIAVKLRTEGTDTVFFQPVIDGEPAARFEVKQGADRTITLASGLSSGDHDVELYRDTEGTYGVSTFLGFTGGTVKGAKSGNGRLIEVIGDSISAAYGAAGSESHVGTKTSCSWSASNSPWYRSYGALAGHALGAEVSTIARSGWGMVRDASGNTNNVMPKIWDSLFGSSSTTKWGFGPKPSVVVINLGTNDWNAGGDPGAGYETAYLDFLKRVRAQYPDAWLFLSIGSIFEKARIDQVMARLNRVVASRTASGDSKIVAFDYGSQDASNTGCSWHPDADEHKRMAGILQQKLSEKLGW